MSLYYLLLVPVIALSLGIVWLLWVTRNIER